MDARAPQGRCLPVDMWRGAALCTIFIDHIPGNVFERLTYKNFGLSDAAEAFVFLSGVSVALAFGRHTAPGFRAGFLRWTTQRILKLYAVHILLSLTAVAIFAFGAAATGKIGLLQQHGRWLFIDDPQAAILGLLCFGHQIGYFNILPVYVVMLAMTPAMLWLAHLDARLLLASSLALYALARLGHFNLPSWPEGGEWFLNPATWQLMLALGIAAGLRTSRRPVPRRRDLAVLAGAIVAAGAICGTGGLGLWPELTDLAHISADVGKTMLGSGRIVHFLGVCYLIYYVRIGAGGRGVLHDCLARIGRRGLWSYAWLSLLAAVGQVIVYTEGHWPPIDAALIGGGIASAALWAALLDRIPGPRTRHDRGRAGGFVEQRSSGAFLPPMSSSTLRTRVADPV